jgi:predicted amidophosphoribosyltransferase
MFLPIRCPLCGVLGAAPCAACVRSFEVAPALSVPEGCTTIEVAYRYHDAVRELVLALKYRNRRDCVAFCAAALAGVSPAADVVSWVPSTPARVRARGFDQAEVLARAVGRGLRLPVRPTLRRVGDTPQTGLDAVARRAGPAFVVRPRHVPGAVVLLVDDIVTTGSTFSHAGQALRAAGAAAVHARAFAWTPPRSGTYASDSAVHHVAS